MGSALNDRYFGASALTAARGGLNPQQRGWPEFNGGIIMAQRVGLKVGQRYFRFAASRTPLEGRACGAWWIEFETLNSISRFAYQHSTPRDSVRYFLSVPWQWSEVDRLVHGILEQPLDAYRGVGRAVHTAPEGHPRSHVRDRGTAYIPPQHLPVYQLYVPGMREIGQQAFPRLLVEDIWTSSYFSR